MSIQAPLTNSKPPTDFRRVAGGVRADLDRAELNGRSRRLAEFAVKVTLMQNRTRVVIPNRERVCALLKIGKNHVAEVLCALESARILRVREVADGWEVLINSDSKQWLVDWIYEREEMLAYLNELNRAAGQAQEDFGKNEVSFEPAPDLGRVLAEVSAEVSGAVSSQNGNHRFKGVREFKTPTSKACSLESLRWALLEIEHGSEQRAMAGMRMILGDDVMEPSTRNPMGDGGKWRNRFRSNPHKVQRVMAAVVERMNQVKVRFMGAEAEERWKEFK